MTAPPVLLNGAPENYLIDAGVFFIGSSLVLYGNTVGGLKWAPGTETRHVEFDGKREDIEGQHRDIGGSSRISGKFLIGSDASLIQATPGAESDGSSGANTITPLDNDIFWPEGAYMDDGLYCGRRQDNKINVIWMPRFFIKTSGFSSADKNEVGWDVEAVSVLPRGTTNLSAKSYRYVVVDDLDALVSLLT